MKIVGFAKNLFGILSISHHALIRELVSSGGRPHAYAKENSSR
jgi:hypothetical protein